ncbi:hypothetical protein GCM10020001_020410 [Nonomuraea salmonea]
MTMLTVIINIANLLLMVIVLGGGIVMMAMRRKDHGRGAGLGIAGCVALLIGAVVLTAIQFSVTTLVTEMGRTAYEIILPLGNLLVIMLQVTGTALLVFGVVARRTPQPAATGPPALAHPARPAPAAGPPPGMAAHPPRPAARLAAPARPAGPEAVRTRRAGALAARVRPAGALAARVRPAGVVAVRAGPAGAAWSAWSAWSAAEWAAAARLVAAATRTRPAARRIVPSAGLAATGPGLPAAPVLSSAWGGRFRGVGARRGSRPR